MPVMENLKARQKELYETHTVHPDELRMAIDRHGFAFGIRTKEKKLGQILRSLAIVPRSSVLDIGCREGRFLNKLNAGYGVRGTGIDISLRQLQENVQNNPFGNRYSVADAEALPFKGEKFDFVFCFDVFEHLPHPEKCLSEIARVLKPGAAALIYAINKQDSYTWHWFLRRVSFSKAGVDSGEFDDHDRNNFVRAQDIAASCAVNRLAIDKIIFFDSFFTLAYDEMLPAAIRLARRDAVENARGGDKESAPPHIPTGLRICSALTAMLLPVLEWLDRPWSDRGYSNGFFVVARKQ
jgi:SAM-dependent methyltransferase